MIRSITATLVTLTFFATIPMTRSARAANGPKPLGAESIAAIDRAVAAGIELKMTPGAVVVAGRAGGTVFIKGYGRYTYEPDAPKVAANTIFDLASLSKPIGGATSIMILADRGKLSVTDPVSKYIPGMRVPDKEKITIEQCLLHTAGFVGDNPMKDFDGTPQESFAKIYGAKLKYPPGKDYLYSDNSFLVLGDVVRAVSGQPLDEFAKANVFGPLKMTDTGYNPDVLAKSPPFQVPYKGWVRFAPTEKRDGQWMAGQVHDPRAWALGGVAGHAGVFGTGEDVARWCRMLLNQGELDGAKVLSEKTVAEMVKPRSMKDATGATVVRAYGLDVDSRHSPAPRGRRFAKGKTFGHTGYTGTSFWIDPENGAFVVLLTNRVHPDDDAEIGTLRKRIATIVAEALLGEEEEGTEARRHEGTK